MLQKNSNNQKKVSKLGLDGIKFPTSRVKQNSISSALEKK